MAQSDPETQPEPIDYDAIRRTLSEHPVQLAIVFGSRVRGNAHATSDIDIAVEFKDSVYEEEYTETRLSVIAGIMSALGQDDVDVADLRDMKPAVGKSALEHGVLILGSPERADHFREDFEKRMPEHDRSRRERFDEILDDIEAMV